MSHLNFTKDRVHNSNKDVHNTQRRDFQDLERPNGKRDHQFSDGCFKVAPLRNCCFFTELSLAGLAESKMGGIEGTG